MRTNHLTSMTLAISMLATMPAAAQIALVEPDQASTTGGALLTIHGSNFAGATDVTVGGRICQLQALTDTEVRCVVPEGEGTSHDVVLVDPTGGDMHRAPASFSYAAPTLASIAPDHGPTRGGTTLTLLGQHFGLAPVPLVDDKPCANVQRLSHNEVQCDIAEGSGVGLPVSVIVGGQLSNDAPTPFSYDAPSVVQVSPQSAPTSGGALLTIVGDNFGLNPVVDVDGRSCTVVFAEHNEVRCRLPEGEGAGLAGGVFVDGQLAQFDFGYLPPNITGVTPQTVPTRGGTITITGTNFGVAPQVTYDGRPCVSSSSSHTEVVCDLPEGEGTGGALDMVVAGQLTSWTGALDYAAPSLETLSPQSAPTSGGTRLTLHGDNFGTSSSVTVGGQPCVVDAQDPGNIPHLQTVCVLPAGEGADLAVELDAGGRLAQGLTFSYDPPALSSVAPAEIPRAGGVRLTIHGANFGVSPSVTVGGTSCEVDPTTTTHTSLECVAPPGADGDARVSIHVGGQTEGTNPLYVSYMAPSCGPGRFDDGAVCQPCQPGTFQDLDVATSCTPCAVGTFTATSGSASCQLCPEGRYVDQQGAAQCLSCPQGTSSSTTGSESCEMCAPGTFADQSGQRECQLCPEGTFASTSGANACVPCPQGTTSEPGATQCHPTDVCQPGTFRDVDGTCVACAAGRFSSTANADVCLPCPRGAFAPSSGASQCEVCQPGTFADVVGSTSCSSCAAGTYGAEPGMDSCLPCAVGSFAAAGATECNLCLPGSAASTSGSASCEACAPGTYASTSGSASCVSCPAGTTSSTGATMCFDDASCLPGTYVDTADDSCVPCAEGRFSADADALECEACPVGTYADDVGQAACTSCAPGSATATSGSAACAPCTPGTYAAVHGSGECVACAPGTFSSSGAAQCELCAPGTFADAAGFDSCTPCAAGTFSAEAGAATCLPCPQGMTSSEGGAFCFSVEACAPGTYADPVDGACVTCVAGTFSADADAAACVPCPAGRFAADDGATSCETCPVGRFAPEGAATCSPCAAGTFADVDGSAECVACGEGQFSGEGSATCETCAPGTFAQGGGASSCAACPAGTFMPEVGARECIPCRAGEEPNQDATACLPVDGCAPGTVHDVERDVCVSCAAGTFSDTHDAAVCQACPDGTTSQDGAAACYSVDACPPGTQVNAAGECLPCGAGTFSEEADATSCEACPQGTASSTEGSARCTPCAPGTVADAIGAVACRLCPEGTRADASHTFCVDDTACLPGTEPNLDGTCSRCREGTFSPAPNSACLACPLGTFSADGAERCVACEPGTVVDVEGATSCTACPAGTFMPEQGGAFCLPCAAGTTSMAGADVCFDVDDCAPGSFRADDDSCVACAPGSFSDDVNATGCFSCRRGTYAPDEGAQECTPCPAGTFASDDGALQCAPCPAGRFADIVGAVECMACPAGTTSDEGATSCVSTAGPECGDGNVDDGEDCDDGARRDNDGCSAMCRREPGWDCATGSGMCVPIFGDGLIVGSETCDDGNDDDDDGCTLGAVDDGYGCDGQMPSTCAPFDTCGDGELDANEACDDGNLDDGDGCSAQCSVEDAGGGAVCRCVTTPSSATPLLWVFGLLAIGLRRRRRHGPA